jgi:membrane-bound lytic murein transglycosylase B
MLIGTILFSNCQASENKNALATSDKSQNKIQSEIFQSVVDSLVNRGVDTAFIKKYIESDNLIFGDRYIKINVTGYLKKTDYSFVTNQNSVTKSKEFMTKNLSTLTAVEEKYGVPKEIITAIL